MADLARRIADLSSEKCQLLLQRLNKKQGDVFSQTQIKPQISESYSFFTSWSTLVVLQSGGSRQPFFCVHPGGGTVLSYVDLARHLGPEQPFYGLDSLGFPENQKPYTQLEDMAAHYIKAMQTVQQQGPYFLGGWSFGGYVAFEIAQQLQQQNQQVSFLALLDISALDLVAPEDLQEQEDEAFLMNYLAGLVAEDNFRSLNLERIRQLTLDEQLNFVIEQAKYVNRLPPDFGLAQARRMLQVFKSHGQAINSYRLQPYLGRVTLFLTSEGEVACSQNPTLGWGELAAQGVEIHWVPGDHKTLIHEPHVKVLAEQLRTCLEHVQIST